MLTFDGFQAYVWKMYPNEGDSDGMMTLQGMRWFRKKLVVICQRAKRNHKTLYKRMDHQHPDPKLMKRLIDNMKVLSAARFTIGHIDHQIAYAKDHGYDETGWGNYIDWFEGDRSRVDELHGLFAKANDLRWMMLYRSVPLHTPS